MRIFTAKGSDLDSGLVIGRAVIVFLATLVYVRFAKKRFIAQASAVDLVMVVILGSLMSRAINGGATLLSSLTAGGALVVLQRLVAHFSARSEYFANVVKGTSQVILRDGQIDEKTMRDHDISLEDLLQEMRINAQIDDVKQVRVATLERSGQISAMRQGAP